jgi:hypothetical protein
MLIFFSNSTPPLLFAKEKGETVTPSLSKRGEGGVWFLFKNYDLFFDKKSKVLISFSNSSPPLLFVKDKGETVPPLYQRERKGEFKIFVSYFFI